MIDADKAWQAFTRRDRSFDGRFVIDVLTTGIYCRPSCAARQPRRENVRFFADGAADMLTPFIWRMDTFGRPHLEQTPWAPDMPSDYLPGHVYFIQDRLDGPGDADYAAEWLRMTGKEDMLLFGSSYPDWRMASPDGLPPAWTAEQRAKVLGGNAARLYGLHAAAAARA